MATGELVVVPEHRPLQLEPLAQERKSLDLLLRLLTARVIRGQRHNVLNKPDVGALCQLLVAVDLLLLVTPFREWLRVSPHGNLARVVDQLEVAGNTLEFLVGFSMLDTDLKKSISRAVAVGISNGDGGEFLVGRIVRRSNIVREQDGIRNNVAKPDEIMVLDGMTELLIVRARGKDLPVVVGIVERVACHLLTLARHTAIVISQRVLVRVAVKVGLGLLVPDADGVIVINGDGIGEHNVVTEGLLELGGHKVIARSRASEDREVNLEPEEVKDEGHNDQTKSPSRKVLAKLGQSQSATGTLDVQKIPQVDAYGRTNRDEGEEADILGGDIARKGEASQDQPFPPLPGEGLVPQLVELDIAEQAARHSKDQGGIEENQASLANVSVVKEDKTGGNQTSWKAITRLPHDQIDNRDGEGTENGGKRAKGDIRDLVADVGIANVLEVEVAIIADQPAHEGKEKLAKGRVHIKKVCSLEIIGRELCDSPCQPWPVDIRCTRVIKVPFQNGLHRTRPHRDG